VGVVIAATPFLTTTGVVTFPSLAPLLNRLGQDQIAHPPREAALLSRWQGFFALSHIAVIGTTAVVP
jgi:hypothetical protein